MSTTEKTKCEIIDGAIEILSDRERWDQGYMARSASGMSVPVEDSSAVRFCSIGAVLRAAGPDATTGNALLSDLAALIEPRSKPRSPAESVEVIWRWNDGLTSSRGHTYVMRKFRLLKARVCA